jgi:hypothetical protein
LSRNQRLSLLGLAAVVLVVAFVVARSGGGDDSGSTTTTPAAPVDAHGARPAPQRDLVVVKDAKPVDGIQRFTYKKGGTIDFTVRSDTADEVHFHGYDIGKDVKAGGTVRFRVPAKIDGRFEVELEDHKEQIAEVEVQP